MPVICGLRNPGAQYQGTRHNLGFEVVADLARRHQQTLKRGPLRVRAEIARVQTPQMLLMAPLTFMNESGRAVRAVLAYYKLEVRPPQDGGG
ncbi:MAG: aminoacyl-tRNA hydrolase [Actinobacteria bacterium]|nr:aminoacyl-tRNA hydrolase [Actinomycetota bacterium]